MRVITGRHGCSTNGRADAHVPFASSFTQLDIAVIQVAYLPDGGIAHLAYQANFTRGHSHLGVIAFFGQQLSSNTGCADELTAFTFFQLNIVDQRTNRDIRDRQAVARTNFGLRARHQGVANLQIHRSDDIAFLTICIEEQRQASRAVRIVLNRSDFRRDPVFFTLVIDEADMLADDRRRDGELLPGHKHFVPGLVQRLGQTSVRAYPW